MDSISHEICGQLSEVDRPAPLFAISFIYDEWANRNLVFRRKMIKKQKDDKITTNNLSSNKSMNVSLMISLFFFFLNIILKYY